MRIAFVTRSTLYDVPGGDTVLVLQTVKQFRELGAGIDINLTNDKINYSLYHLFHFINITRPSDILFDIAKTKKPFALSPIVIDYSEYDRQHCKGNPESIFNEIEKVVKMNCQTALQQKFYVTIHGKRRQRSLRKLIKKSYRHEETEDRYSWHPGHS